MNTEPFTHLINGVRFIIEEDEPGVWFWTNGVSESKRPLDSQAEALTDAMRWVREQAEEEDERGQSDEHHRGLYIDQKIAERLEK